MKNITFKTNEQLWKIENAAASAGYKKTDDCYWAQIFRNEETGHEFSTRREENSTNDPVAGLVAMLTPAKMLQKYTRDFNVLNAKNHEREAEIVAQAVKILFSSLS